MQTRTVITVLPRKHITPKHGLDLTPVHVGFIVDIMALGQVYIRKFRFSSQYFPTNAPYSYFVVGPPTLYNLRTDNVVL
jgi:hypothetical protein